MEFLYGTSFMSQSPEAYERLILDAMRGDATLFTRDDEVEAQWRIIDPILEAWADDQPPLPQYPAGSHGPEEAELDPARRAPVADDLSRDADFMDGVWPEQDTTPSDIEPRSAGAARSSATTRTRPSCRRACSTWS